MKYIIWYGSAFLVGTWLFSYHNIIGDILGVCVAFLATLD
jgi:hypothetical protein